MTRGEDIGQQPARHYITRMNNLSERLNNRSFTDTRLMKQEVKSRLDMYGLKLQTSTHTKLIN
jgi:hypothetical protein